MDTRPGSTLNPFKTARRPTLRGFALGAALWVFGLSFSLLLGLLWGRAVAGDQTTLEESAEIAVESDLVADRVIAWAGDALAAADGVSSSDLQAALDAVWQLPQTREALHLLAREAVASALTSRGTAAVIDPAPLLLPIADDITTALNRAGVLVAEPDVVRMIRALEPLEAGSEARGGLATQVRGALTTALLFALGVMILAGIGALAIGEDRAAVVRSLGLRALLTSLSFLVMLRLGSWALDPSGGAAPLRRGGAVLLGSNAHVPVLVAAIAAAAAAGGGLVAWQKRRRAEAAVTFVPLPEDDRVGVN